MSSNNGAAVSKMLIFSSECLIQYTRVTENTPLSLVLIRLASAEQKVTSHWHELGNVSMSNIGQNIGYPVTAAVPH